MYRVQIPIVALMLLGSFTGRAWSAPRGNGSRAIARDTPRVTPLFTPRDIEDPGHKGLRRVFEQLACLEDRRGPKIVRLAHYGDSIVAGDRVSSAARQVLQARFGDGGHGYLLLRSPTKYYHRQGVRVWRNKYWRLASFLYRYLKNGHYGYGGALTWSINPGALLTLRVRKEGKMGGRVSRVRLYYEQRARGGWLELSTGRVKLGRVSTRGMGGRGGMQTIAFPETSRRLRLVHGGGGVVRLYGLSLERNGPGVVFDGLGMVSTSFGNLLKLPTRHWHRQLRQRRVSLVIFQYGANSSDIRKLTEQWYRRRVKKVLNRLGQARPRISCLVVGPVDRGYSWYRSKKSRPIMRRISQWQRAAALANGCAFWDSLATQGGDGAAKRWFRAKPSLMWHDLTHLTPDGAALMGRLLAQGLLRAYDRFRKKLGSTSCPLNPRTHEGVHRELRKGRTGPRPPAPDPRRRRRRRRR